MIYICTYPFSAYTHPFCNATHPRLCYGMGTPAKSEIIAESNVSFFVFLNYIANNDPNYEMGMILEDG